jgi:hypothetical protein
MGVGRYKRLMDLDVPDPQTDVQTEWEWGDSIDSWDLQYGEKREKLKTMKLPPPKSFIKLMKFVK